MCVSLESTKWIAATSDGDVNILDVSAHGIVPLVRNAPPPARVAGNLYFTCDICEDQLAEWFQTVRALAADIGAAGAPVADGHRRWLFSDTSHE